MTTTWMPWPKRKINKIVKTGGHDHVIESVQEFEGMVVSLVQSAMFTSGLNTMIGYDGVNTKEECIHYLHTLLGHVPKIL
jgi:hypothetical protein